MRQAGYTQKTLKIIGYLVLFTMALVYLFPLLSTVLSAFRTNGDILRNGIFSLPRSWYFGGFSAVWIDGNLATLIKNSAIVAFSAVLLAVLCASLAGHAMAQFRFRLKTLILLAFLSGLFFPAQLYLIPIYKLANRLGIYNTYHGLILVHLAYHLPFSTFLLLGFFRTLPSDFLDAARIDGAGEVKIFIRIVLPLSIPTMGATAILLFTWIWNDFFWGLAMTQGLESETIMVGLSRFSGRLVFNWNQQAAGSLIAMLPPLLIFIAFQRAFIKGVRMGGIK